MKVALCVGGAACVWDDLAALERLVGGAWPGPIIACNDIGTLLPDLDHWATLHAAKLPQWRQARAENGHPSHYETWSCENRTSVDHHWDHWTKGSSGFYELGVALEGLGRDRAILAGIPMDAGKHAFRQTPWNAYRIYTRTWSDSAEGLRGRVASMSGWTRELFGAPTREFLP